MKRAAMLAMVAMATLALPPAGRADPMRPLAGADAAASGVPGASAAPAASAPLGGRPPAAADVPAERVVAIHLDADGVPRALVGERWLRVGDRLDGVRISAIDANTVVLGTGRAARRLHLLPPLQYSAPASTSASAPARRRAPPPRRAAPPAAAASLPADAASSTGPRPAARIPQGTSP